MLLLRQQQCPSPVPLAPSWTPAENIDYLCVNANLPWRLSVPRLLQDVANCGPLMVDQRLDGSQIERLYVVGSRQEIGNATSWRLCFSTPCPSLQCTRALRHMKFNGS